MLQFNYSDIREPIVTETDEKFTISYFEELENWDIEDCWLTRIHCDVINSCRGYFDPCKIQNSEDEELDMPELFKRDEDDEIIDFNLPDGYPEYAVRYLAGYCHSTFVWCETDNISNVDAVLWVDPEYIAELREKYEEFVVHDMITADLKRCRRILDAEQFYTNNQIEIDKETGETDLMGMVTYLYEEHCTEELLKDHLDGENCEFKLIPLNELISCY